MQKSFVADPYQPMSEDSYKRPSSKLFNDWRIVYQHLQRGDYAAAAAWVEEAQLAAQTEEPLMAALLTTVHQICLACQECRVKIAWHEQAIQESEQREAQLRLRAQAMLDHLREQTASGSMEVHTKIEDAFTDPQNWTLSFWAYLWLFLYRYLPQLTLPSDTNPTDSAPSDTIPLDTIPLDSIPIETIPIETVSSDSESAMAPSSLSTIIAAVPAEAVMGKGEDEVVFPTLHSTESDELPSSSLEAAPANLFAPTKANEEAPTTVETPRSLTAPNPPDLRQADTEAAQDTFDFIIYCFGSCRVYQKGLLIEEWNGLKGLSLFKYLVMQRGTPVTKDRLMDLFWPDADPEAARRNLHQAIYSLRRTLRQRDPAFQHIQFEHNQYLLNPDLSVWVDVEEFLLHVQRGQRLEATQQLAEAMAEYGIAEGLYQGDFLAEDLYEEWTVRGRDQYRTTYLQIVDRLSQHYLEQGAYTAAIAICQKILTYDRSYEEAHRRLMHCYLAQGQRHLAIRQYHTCVQALADELDVPPDEETKALYASITSHS